MKQAFLEVWAVDASDSPNSYLRVPNLVLCRNIFFSILTAVIVVAICVVLTVQLDIERIITVDDSISQIEVRNCFVTIDTDFNRESTFVTIDRSTVNGAQVLSLTGSNTGLCSAKISISAARSSPLTIRGSDSTILLSSSTNISYPFDLTVKSPRSATGTVRILIGGAAFNTLNLDTSSALVVVDANTLLPEIMNINVDFGVVAVAAPKSAAESSMFQKLSFEANVSDGGYCLTPTSSFPDLTYTITQVNVSTTTTSADGNTTTTTIVKSLVAGELLPSITARTATLKINSSSFYVTRKTVEEKDAGSFMNESQTLRPLVAQFLLGSRDFSDTQVNSQYVQAVEVVAPYAGAVFLNSNSRFAIQFGPALLSLLSGFQLSPSYRRLNSALSHYTCMNDTFINRISAAISVTPFDSLEDTATNVDLSTERYLPDEAIADLYNSIVNLTADSALLTAFSLVSFDLESTTNIVGTFKTVEFDGDEFSFVDLKRSVGQWILLVFTVFLGVYVALGVLIVLIVFRGDLVRVFYLQESRSFIRQIVRTGVGRCAYHLYRSLYAFHAMCALHLVRLISYIIRTLVPSASMTYFVSWMLRVVEPAQHKHIAGGTNSGAAGMDDDDATMSNQQLITGNNNNDDNVDPQSPLTFTNNNNSNGVFGSPQSPAAGGKMINKKNNNNNKKNDVDYYKQQQKLEAEKSRIITIDQLLDLYSASWALRYSPRLDFTRSRVRQILKDEGMEVKVLEVDAIMGITSAVTNTEVEGEYLFDDLYRTTPNEYDQVTAYDIANSQFLNKPVANTSVKQVIEEARARGLPIKKVEEECVINARWSPAAFVEKISLDHAARAEASFASFPAYVELRPDVEFFDGNKNSNKSLWESRQEVIAYLVHQIFLFFTGLAQAVCHALIALCPFIFMYLIFEGFVKETTKYSLTTRSFVLVELLFGVVSLEVDPTTLQPIGAFILVGFFLLTLIEPFLVIMCRTCSPLSVMKIEYIIRYPLSILLAFIYVLSWLFIVAYFIMVLLWWVLGSIVSPNVMLAFAASALTIVGVLSSTYTALTSSREAIMDRIQERILETLLDILKRSGLQFSDGSLDSENSELTIGLLADVADQKPEALEKLGQILQIPGALIISVLAIQSRDPLKLKQASEHLLQLCEIPTRYKGVVSLMMMKAMNLPVPTTQLTQAVTDIVPDATARNLLKSAHHGINPLVDALLHKENGKTEVAFSRIFDGLIAVVQDFVIKKSKGLITRQMLMPLTELVYASFGDGKMLNLTSSAFDSSSLKRGAKSASNAASSLASQLHSSISNSANKADFILSKLLILLEEVAPVVLEEADYELEKLFLVLVEGVKFALGREDNQFVMQLLYSLENFAGITEDPLFEDSFESVGCLRLWRVVSTIDPIAEQMVGMLLNPGK